MRRVDTSKLKAPAGKMYEVDINADPEHFLDWDKPLHEQPLAVQEAAKASGIHSDYAGPMGARIQGDSPMGELAGRQLQSPASLFFRKLQEAGVRGVKYLDQGSRGITREELLTDIAQYKDEIARVGKSADLDMRGRDRLDVLKQRLAEREDRLANWKPPTSNYVVFDDKLIDIIKKYGLAGLIAGGAAHFTAPADNAQGMARGGPAQTDDGTLTEEELAQVNRAWRGLIEDKAHGGKMHYTMPPVRGMAPPGSFRIPKDVFEALGDGDLKVGGAVVHSMFGIEDDPEDPTVVHPHAVRIIGEGSLAAGRRVLEKFVAQVRDGARDYVIPQPDGNHGRVVRRAAR